MNKILNWQLYSYFKKIVLNLISYKDNFCSTITILTISFVLTNKIYFSLLLVNTDDKYQI